MPETPAAAAAELRVWAEALRDRAGYIDVDANCPIEWWEQVVSDVLVVLLPALMEWRP